MPAVRQALDATQLRILEHCSLNSWSQSPKEMLLDLLEYDKLHGGQLSHGELERCLKALELQGLLVNSSGRWRCPPELAADMAASAVLQGRFPRLAAQRAKSSRRSVYNLGGHQREDTLFLVLSDNWSSDQAVEQVVDSMQNPASLGALPERLRSQQLVLALPRRASQLQPLGIRLAYLELLQSQQTLSPRGLLVLGECWLLQGRLQELQELLQKSGDILSLEAALAFFEGNYSKAYNKFCRSRSVQMNSDLELIGLLDYLVSLGAENWPRAQALQPVNFELRPWLQWFASVRSGKLSPRPHDPLLLEGQLGLLLPAAMAHWERDPRLAHSLEEALHNTSAQAEANGFALAAELLRDLHGPGLGQTFLQVLPCQDGWQLSLQALLELSRPLDVPNNSERLSWVLQPSVDGSWTVEPKIQKWGKSGWTPGRSILLTGQPPPNSSKDDRRILDLLRSGHRNEAWLALVGHPNLVLENRRVELSAGVPELLVQRHSDHLFIQLQPSHYHDGMAMIQDAPDRLKLVRLNPEQEKLAAVLGRAGLMLPEQEQESLQQLLIGFSQKLSISSDVSFDTKIEERNADIRLYLRLAPHQQGLHLQALVRPFGEDGPDYPAGQGTPQVVVRLAGRALQATRQLEQEIKLLTDLGLKGTGPWNFPEPQACLELLELLESLSPELYKLEWPEGQPFTLKQRIDSDSFKLSLTSQGDWFEASGQLELGPEQTLELEQLLLLVRQTPGRFLPLGDNEFVALSHEFQQRLQVLADVAQPAAQGQVRLHGLTAALLEEIPGLKADKAFKDRLKKLHKLDQLQPKIPAGFKADLRDYQSLGFRWLYQRAEGGLGACLADDMGLGKTVQTLALLLARAKQGPALVIAPTSVVGNWLEEAARFAPALRLHDLRQIERERLLQSLGPLDLVIASYGIAVNEVEKVSQVAWATLVLDEAQAFKNSQSQRFQAIQKIPAQARLATTGTPLENRLEELWSLFRILNPGLLGSLESFRQRFVVPIEGGDAQRRDTLRRLIHPFLLRRRKSEVLQELPPRTEVTLEIELSAAERVFYEALRLRALDNLSQESPQPIKVLAELMRLRRACCHPTLVDNQVELSSESGAKLDALMELLGDLIQEDHRALVFSQFVDHLSIIRQALDRAQISYQYLDGSTPAKERDQRVADFQAGQGQVFLISLRAGGVGLNLTAADYVIHMDPWWNPAVEDQASDRAHRLGQQRPVTVYRLVAKQTIEEKILALHARKRELAQSLLEGAEGQTRLNAQELLQLISESN